MQSSIPSSTSPDYFHWVMTAGSVAVVVGAVVAIKGSVITGVAIVCIGAIALAYGYANQNSSQLDPKRVSSASDDLTPPKPQVGPVATPAPPPIDLSSSSKSSSVDRKDHKSEPKAVPPKAASIDRPFEKQLKEIQALFSKDNAKNARNLLKATLEHRAATPNDAEAYATPEELVVSTQEASAAKAEALQFSHVQSEDIGLRHTMEDAWFYREIDEGIIAAVFDGHGGDQVSKHANGRFQTLFPENLRKHSNDFRAAITETIHSVHEDEVVKKNGDAGTTMVFLFIEKTTGLAYTATLADSEANVYRKMERGLLSIPLSAVRNWSSKKDEARAEKEEEHSKKRSAWLGCPGKYRRYPLQTEFNSFGVNMSRCIGDHGYITNELRALSRKPKVTVFPLAKRDTIVLTCDGLKDFVPETDIVAQVAKKPDNLAKALVDASLTAQRSGKGGDNVTVIAINVT